MIDGVDCLVCTGFKEITKVVHSLTMSSMSISLDRPRLKPSCQRLKVNALAARPSWHYMFWTVFLYEMYLVCVGCLL